MSIIFVLFLFTGGGYIYVVTSFTVNLALNFQIFFLIYSKTRFFKLEVVQLLLKFSLF